MRPLRCILVLSGLLLGASVPLLAAPGQDERPASVRWPSLERQLADAQAPPGSALERVIAANQRFDILAPEEAVDKLGLPPWIRVLWRERHPGAPVPGDATHGYPLALHEVYEWMVAHPDLEPTVDLDLANQSTAVEKRRGTPPPPPPSVATETDTSGDSRVSHSESDVRVDYWNPNRLLVMANSIGASQSQMGVAYSDDYGASWRQTTLPAYDGSEDFQSDPAVDWTSDGTGWALGLTIAGGRSSDPQLRLFAQRSTDGGATWHADALVSGDQVSADKEMIWVDHSGRSPYRDQIYAVWHNDLPVYVSHRSTDGSWSDPLQVSGAETTGTGIGADVKTNALGHVFVFWPDTGSGRLLVSRSTDGGRSFGKPVTIGTTFQRFQTVVPAQAKRAALVYVTGGAFVNGKRSEVYAAWQDLTGAAGCRTPFDDPQDNVDSPCKARIWFSRSLDGGQRWTKPRMVNNQAELNDQFNPWLAVDETTGVLGLMYYDTIGEARTSTNVWYQSSRDGGNTWSSPVRVTSQPSDETGTSLNQYGDYNGMSAYAGQFYPAWTDRRGGALDKVWAARIEITGGRTRKAACDPRIASCLP